MGKNSIIITFLFLGLNIYAQSFTAMEALGFERKIEWITSQYGNGFGHKIYNDDPGGKTLLNIASRHNSATWVDAFTVTSEGKIGIGTTSPRTKLEVNGSLRTRNLTVDNPLIATDWNELWQSGFYQSFEGLNAPEPQGWFWGIIMNHSTNTPEYKFSGQIAVKNDYNTPTMYFRSTNRGGEGIWTKVLHDTGNQVINGKLEAKEIKVTTTPTADFVFNEDYNLPSIEFVENYVNENKHLPGVASAEEMTNNGVNIGQFQIKLLQKIEELTLYTIDQEKRLDNYEDVISKLSEMIKVQQGLILKLQEAHD